MKVSQLISILQSLPQDATVWHLWDGEARTEINHVWLGRGGAVITADCDHVAYSTCDRPFDAPDENEEPSWRTPETPLLSPDE